MLITTQYFVTVCLEPNEVLRTFCFENARSFYTYKKTRFFISNPSQINHTLFKISATNKSPYRRVGSGASSIHEKQGALSTAGVAKRSYLLHSSLRSNGIVMGKLLRLRNNQQLKHLIKMFEEDEDLLEDVIIENNQAIENG